MACLSKFIAFMNIALFDPLTAITEVASNSYHRVFKSDSIAMFCEVK